MADIATEEIIDIVDRFLNDNGLWDKFVAFVEKEGYSVGELGFPEGD